MNVQNGYCDFHTYFNKDVENKHCLSKSTMEQCIIFLQHQTLILSQEKNGALKGNDWTQMKTVIDSEIENIKKKN